MLAMPDPAEALDAASSPSMSLLPVSEPATDTSIAMLETCCCDDDRLTSSAAGCTESSAREC